MMGSPDTDDILRRNSKLFGFVALLVIAPAVICATTVRECNFLVLERAAGTIFHGRCVKKTEVTAGAPVPYTEYRFRVLSAVKGCRDRGGKLLETLTIRHAGRRKTYVRPDGTKAVPLRLGLPTYRVGEEVVLFLTRESRLGLCSPVGLYQGKFSVRRRGNRISVRNALYNAGLFKRVEPQAFETGTRPLFRAVRGDPSRLELRRFLELCRGVKR